MKEHFDPTRYTVIDNQTGEILDMSMFIHKINKRGWEKAYAKVVAEYINCSGDKPSQLLAWIISNRDHNNIVSGTMVEMSEKAQVSLSLTKKILSKLQKGGFVKKIRSGSYIVTPRMIRNGSSGQGVVIMKIWDSC